MPSSPWYGKMSAQKYPHDKRGPFRSFITKAAPKLEAGSGNGAVQVECQEVARNVRAVTQPLSRKTAPPPPVRRKALRDLLRSRHWKGYRSSSSTPSPTLRPSHSPTAISNRPKSACHSPHRTVYRVTMSVDYIPPGVNVTWP